MKNNKTTKKTDKKVVLRPWLLDVQIEHIR